MTGGDSTSPSGKTLSSPRHPEPILVSLLADNHIPPTCSSTTHGLSHYLSWKSKSREGVHAKYCKDVNVATATSVQQGQSCTAQRRQPATWKTRLQKFNQVDNGVRRHAHGAGQETARAGLYVFKSKKGV